MESKKVILSTAFVQEGSGFRLDINVPNGGDVDVRFFLNTGCETDEAMAFFGKVGDGELALQEFYSDNGEKVYFDINDEGELECVMPDGWDGYLDGEGNLIMVPKDGIGNMKVENNFFVY